MMKTSAVQGWPTRAIDAARQFSFDPPSISQIGKRKEGVSDTGSQERQPICGICEQFLATAAQFRQTRDISAVSVDFTRPKKV
jgi:hypothetical protein